MTGFSPTSPVVSVLMAVHGTDSTARRAIESLQAQTLTNFEVIVIDASSAGDTARMLDVMSERDMRIDVTHVAGLACSEALDLALSRARGEYVVVMQPGSWVEPAFLAELTDAAREGGLELAIGGFTVNVALGPREVSLQAGAGRRTFLTQHDFRAAAWSLFDEGLLAPACAKLYDRSLAVEKGVSFAATGQSDDDLPAMAGHTFELAFLRDVERVGMVGTTRCHVAVSLRPGEGPMAAARAFDRLEGEYAATLDLLREWGMEGDAASMEVLQRRYVEMLASCIDAIASRGPIAPTSAEVERISKMIVTDRAQLAASVAEPRDGFTRAMMPSIRNGNARKAYTQAKLWGLLRHGMPAGMVPDAYV